jgi:hypothetical protein
VGENLKDGGGRKPVGKNHLEDLDVYGKIILKCIVKKRY